MKIGILVSLSIALSFSSIIMSKSIKGSRLQAQQKLIQSFIQQRQERLAWAIVQCDAVALAKELRNLRALLIERREQHGSCT